MNRKVDIYYTTLIVIMSTKKNEIIIPFQLKMKEELMVEM